MFCERAQHTAFSAEAAAPSCEAVPAGALPGTPQEPLLERCVKNRIPWKDVMDYRAKAARFRENAEEIRSRTEHLEREAKAVFFRLAEDYECMADIYETLAGMKDSVG